MTKNELEVQQLLFELANNGEIGEGAIRGELQVLAQMASKKMAKEIQIIVENGNSNLRETILELSGIKIEVPEDEEFKKDDRVTVTIEDKKYTGIITKIVKNGAKVHFDDGDTGEFIFEDLSLENVN